MTDGRARARYAPLFLASLLALYLQLTVIRWLPGQVRVIAYFTNFILIACFFGLGLGMLTARRSGRAAAWAAPALLGLVLLTIAFHHVWVRGVGSDALLVAYEGPARPRLDLYLMLTIFYLAISGSFLPVGQAIGRAFGTDAPLKGYAANLLGSLAGVAGFSLLSLYALPAWSWFLLAVPGLAMLAPRGRARVLAVVCGAATVAATYVVGRGEIWSPYHKIEVGPMALDQRGYLIPSSQQRSGAQSQPLPREVGFIVRVNDDFYQLPVDLSDASLQRYPPLGLWRHHYDIPFRLKPAAGRALVAGAGTGNDVAAALRSGARQVDMVDIDPEIVRLGREGHPEHPYADPRVRVYVDDARHFFKGATPGYDVVVFGLLDSHRLIGALSSLRLDSYVFTVESFREVRRLLAPGGIQVTAFAVATPRFVERLRAMLKLAYGEDPVVLGELGIPSIGVVMVSGPGVADLGLLPTPARHDAGVVPATDDWPFFYAAGRSVPGEYLVVLGLVGALSILGVAAAAGMPRWRDAHFFCLGVGFMLLETRNVTTVALAFGSTWYVNSVVFSSILIMALASALVVARGWRPPLRLAYLLLLAAVLLNYAVPLGRLAGGGVATRLLLVGGLTALPLLFSGFVFARSFATVDDPPRALAANILGGVLGGIIEYLGMITGLQYLLLIAALFYLLSALLLRR
jgi:SAM-dependent methyltransferase